MGCKGNAPYNRHEFVWDRNNPDTILENHACDYTFRNEKFANFCANLAEFYERGEFTLAHRQNWKELTE